MKENEKSETENRPATGWDKVHAVGIFILGIAAIVMVGSSLINRIVPARVAQTAQQPVAPKTVNVLSPYGLPPVQTIDGKAVSCAAPATYEDLAHAFVCVCKAPKHPPIGSGGIWQSHTQIWRKPVWLRRRALEFSFFYAATFVGSPSARIGSRHAVCTA